MENLFRLFKFLMIPLRVPLGVVSMVTVGPLAFGISTAAITIGTTAVARFGKSNRRIADPDFERITDAMMATMSFLAAVANPFDELQNLSTGNFSSLKDNDDFSDKDKDDIKALFNTHADEIGSDINFHENIPVHKANKILEERGATPEKISAITGKHKSPIAQEEISALTDKSQNPSAEVAKTQALIKEGVKEFKERPIIKETQPQATSLNSTTQDTTEATSNKRKRSPSPSLTKVSSVENPFKSRTVTQEV